MQDMLTSSPLETTKSVASLAPLYVYSRNTFFVLFSFFKETFRVFQFNLLSFILLYV